MPELLYPRMADVYREKVGSLCLALKSEESRTGAVDAIRALIDAILLEPDKNFVFDFLPDFFRRPIGLTLEPVRSSKFERDLLTF